MTRTFLWIALATAGFAACAPKPAAPPASSVPDLSGVWVMPVGNVPRNGPDSQWSNEKIPFTAVGRAAFDAIKPSGGPRQVRSALTNDPQDEGNPTGLIRDLMYAANGRNFEMVQTPTKIVQLISPGKHWRIIYTDDRPVPEDIAAGPFWYGYSVGKWEADTLVVHTLALDDRAWLDDWGLPTGPDTRVEERWKRIAPDKLQLTITVSDTAFFTQPWTSVPLVYGLEKPGVEPYETILAPVDLEQFNKTLLLPSAGTRQSEGSK